MAVSTTQLEVRYTGTGGSGPFTIPFPFLATAHILAGISADGVAAPVLLSTADYTVTRLRDGSGGSLTTADPVASPAVLVISRQVPLTQPTVFQLAGPVPPKSSEVALDRLLMQMQQVDKRVTDLGGTPVDDTPGIAFSRWNPSVPYVFGDIVTGEDDNQYRCILAHSGHNPVYTGGTYAGGTYWQLAIAGATMAIHTPAQFTTIADAWTFISAAYIGANATVTIQVADGTYTMGGDRLTLNHPCGSRIRLVGNATTPADCILDFNALTGETDGDYYQEDWGAINVANGHVLGWLNGFKLVGPSLSEYGVAGILAFNGARVICGPQLVVQDFYAGLAAVNHSYIQCDGVYVSGGGDGNLFVYNGSAMSAQGCISEGANSWYGKSGAMVEHGSALFAPNSTFRNNVGSQVACHYGSTVMLQGSTFLAEGGLAGATAGVEMVLSDNCDVQSCTFTGVKAPRARIVNVDTLSSFSFLFGSTTYAGTAFAQFVGQNATLTALALTQENIATAYLGFTASSTALVLANDGPSITLKVASSGSLGGSVAASFTAAKATVPKLNISAIPTSASGLAAGDVWSNSGVLTIV